MPSTFVLKPLPGRIHTPDEFEAWLASLRLSPGTTEELPLAWEKAFGSAPELLPHGFVATTPGPFPRLVQCRGEDVRPFNFQEAGVDGQPLVFLVG